MMEMEEDETLERKVLPARSTRGQKHKVETEEDVEFWKMQMFQDEEEDEEFEMSGEEYDEVDSDFDLSEEEDNTNEQDVEAQVRRDERRQRKKTGGAGYVDPALKKEKEAKTKTGTGKPVSRAKPRAAMTEQEISEMARRSVRASTRNVTITASYLRQERDKVMEEKRQKRKDVALAKKEPQRRLTQKELLEEAALTEQYNLVHVEEMSAVKEIERKKRHSKKPKLTGPRTVYRSVDGVETITFIDTECYPSKPVRLVGQQNTNPVRCVVTGELARFKDPLTGMPYANALAFKELRRRYAHEKEEKEKEKEKGRALKVKVMIGKGPTEGVGTSVGAGVPPRIGGSNSMGGAANTVNTSGSLNVNPAANPNANAAHAHFHQPFLV